MDRLETRVVGEDRVVGGRDGTLADGLGDNKVVVKLLGRDAAGDERARRGVFVAKHDTGADALLGDEERELGGVLGAKVLEDAGELGDLVLELVSFRAK